MISGLVFWYVSFIFQDNPLLVFNGGLKSVNSRNSDDIYNARYNGPYTVEADNNYSDMGAIFELSELEGVQKGYTSISIIGHPPPLLLKDT